jgi:hypothetical protein
VLDHFIVAGLLCLVPDVDGATLTGWQDGRFRHHLRAMLVCPASTIESEEATALRSPL